MGRKRASNVDETGQLISCKVCGSTAVGRRCGAIVCEACKKFFIRNRNSLTKLRCINGSNNNDIATSSESSSSEHEKTCDITPNNRCCSRCRIVKCLQLGMKMKGKKLKRSVSSASPGLCSVNESNRFESLTPSSDQRSPINVTIASDISDCSYVSPGAGSSHSQMNYKIGSVGSNPSPSNMEFCGFVTSGQPFDRDLTVCSGSTGTTPLLTKMDDHILPTTSPPSQNSTTNLTINNSSRSAAPPQIASDRTLFQYNGLVAPLPLNPSAVPTSFKCFQTQEPTTAQQAQSPFSCYPPQISGQLPLGGYTSATLSAQRSSNQQWSLYAAAGRGMVYNSGLQSSPGTGLSQENDEAQEGQHSPQSSLGSPLNPPKGMVMREPSNLEAIANESMLRGVVRAYPSLQLSSKDMELSINPNQTPSSQELWQSLMNNFESAVGMGLSYVKALPGIRQINLKDRSELFSDSFLPMAAAQQTLNAPPSENENFFLNMTQHTRNIFLSYFPAYNTLMKEVRDIGKALSSWNPSFIEFVFLEAMLFYRTDLPNLENGENVAVLRSRLSRTLEAYLQNTSQSESEARGAMRQFNAVYSLLLRLPGVHATVLSQTAAQHPEIFGASALLNEIYAPSPTNTTVQPSSSGYVTADSRLQTGSSSNRETMAYSQSAI